MFHVKHLLTSFSGVYLMRFNSEIYNKVYHAPEADSGNAGSAGGVVEPQPKQDENGNATDEPKQTTTDININVNVSPAEAEAPGEIDDASDDNTGESEGDDGTNS